MMELGEKRIGNRWPRVLAVVCIVGILATSCRESPRDIPETQIQIKELGLEVIPPPSAYTYPFNQALHSYPLVLQFNIIAKDEDGNLIDEFDNIMNPLDLYRIDYMIVANPPLSWPPEETAEEVEEPTISPPSDDSAVLGPPSFPFPIKPVDLAYPPCPPGFFVDRLDLYGQVGPGILTVKPPVVVPVGVSRIGICAFLHYSSPEGEITSTVQWKSFEVSDPPGTGRYLRYRDGYIRRHLLSVGRGLSWVWLKEYEPGKDPQELLYHSRTFSVQDGNPVSTPVKIYVPWISDDGAIYGGDENPLLRSGLALATLSLEYLVTNNQASLDHAITIFDYIEASEWKDCSGKPTGFFLRSRWPQDDNVEKTPPWYASIDEIAGMTLGLYYFHDALTRSGPEDIKYRVEALVDRLGDHMKTNHYFLVPPIDPYCQLPLERHNGWSGGYLLQWFLNGGFKAITGKSYQSGNVYLDSGFWTRMKALDWHGPGHDDINDLEDLIKLDLNSYERAVLSIKGLGAQMYWQDRKYPLEVNVYSLLPPFVAEVTFMIDLGKWSQYNFPMLLHVFQLGMADRAPEDVAEIKREMGRLIAGVLGTETQKAQFNLHSLANSYIGFPIDFSILLGTGTWVDTEESEFVEVGTEGAVADYYAAAIAQKYGLFSMDTSPFASGFMPVSVLNASIDQAKHDLAIDSPIGQPDYLIEPYHNVLSIENYAGTIILDHNPEKRIGSAFAWELDPGLDDDGLPNRMQGAKAEGELGVTNEMVGMIYDMGLDLVKEGAGLDYMLPTMLLAQSMGASVDVTNGINVPEVFSPDVLLDSCTSFPFYGSLAESNLWYEPCSYLWPNRERDAFDFIDEEYQRNDLIGPYVGGPTQISCGIVTDLTIDHSTLYSRGPGYRTPPIPAKYFTDATKGQPYPNNGVINIWNTDDIDYYAGNCDPANDLYVEVYIQTELPMYHKLVVDGIETTSAIIVDDGRRKLQISVPPKPSHLIMFTGDAVDYELHISSVPFESTIPTEISEEVVPLSPPTGLAATPNADGTVHITWDIQEDAQTYGLRYRKGDDTSFVVISNEVTPPYNHSGLESGGEYYYSVRSYDPIYGWSEYSEEVYVMVAGTVEGECPGMGWYDTNTCIRVTPGDGSILVEWNQLVDEYISWEHWVYWQEVGSGTNWNIKKELYWSSSYLITELQNGVPYTVMVEAWYCQRDEPNCMGETGEIPGSFSSSFSDKVTVMPYEGLGLPSPSP